ncbi:zinc-finger homeodomain protein 5-like [Macadamia integrifolia]|uniref:zinc-finger homeodomain protein 5-like n=1 Tax=Macadamia integrifolia TaxID=60698 RepID=UPI001C4FF4CC|nr:zinc-finger homeodomain protein 5-like [Macadamia integrifolia]
MELRGQQEKEIGMPSSLGYNPPNIRESSSKVSSISIIPPGESAGVGDERRRDGTGNGIAVLKPSTQTLDHHHHHHHHLRPQQQHPLHHFHHDQEPEPDPLPVAIAVAGGSNSARTPTTPKSSVTVRYRDCLKNHAASIGTHVVDGCGEFMPSGEEGTMEALKCAACDCHRNFHRKEVEGEPRTSGATNCYYCYDPNHKNSCSTRIPPPPPPSGPPHAHPTHHHPQLALQHLQQHQKFQLGLPNSPSMASIPPPMMMAYGGGGGGGGGATESSSEDLNGYQSNAGGTSSQPHQAFALSKKRFRTKFTQYQKDKMLEFAERLGWRMQKQDEVEVQRFCDEVSVKRQVLKVWMHNNKHAMKKKQL